MNGEWQALLSTGVPPLNRRAARDAYVRLCRLTKPRGSLGRLEAVVVRLAAITGEPLPRVEPASILVFAGDHGVALRGVSAYPPEVTGQMLENFRSGGAAISVLARRLGAELTVVDAGVRKAPAVSGVLRRSLGEGTQDITLGPAMDRATALASIAVGWEVAKEALDRGARLLVPGEMGIGNTTAAAAVASALTGLSPRLLVGRGTGLGQEGLQRKRAAVEAALAANRPDPADALDVLARVGGFELGGIAGAFLAAAFHRRPALVDGFIASAAALLAERLAPGARRFWIAGHRSAERGHRRVLRALRLRPLLELGLRLGEGTGAALALELVSAACTLQREMATFDEAGVSDREESGPG
ncbi:nicotinate-nucleotide--dimethylbenzimidazole phosphoribosyltransferase [Limnochorda pilosa]|uniref:Nicotinate-nucleotide--dimethylbenzimidazole phosphoribosyltransferase n=1 Tax=Limnochorda pilosa TaxID=1555112 RepID=A0A0K2SQE3_LIMPI|nr:nicotinate-nucleotide--dimethylbenzimidazole phosphoribosyltransferase [Limnochorda pilosa]